MDNLINSWNIIVLRGNKLSEDHAAKCHESCVHAGISPDAIKYFEAVDGTGKEIVLPPNISSQNTNLVKHLLQTVDGITQTEVACYLSHYLLWNKCLAVDEPIVILEHDARVLRELVVFPFINCILYLGNESHHAFENSLDQYVRGQFRVNGKFKFIDRSHAYAIDPAMARNLIRKTHERGLIQAVDSSMRFDDFCIIQPVPFIATVAKSRVGTVIHTDGKPTTANVAFWDEEGFHTSIV